MLVVRAPWFLDFAKACPGFHTHPADVEGGCFFADARPSNFCREWAECVRAAREAENPALGEEDVADAREQGRPRYESLALDELLAGEAWQPHWIRSADERLHINLKEARSAASLVAEQARECPDSKQMYLADSRVSLCSGARGRSA